MVNHAIAPTDSPTSAAARVLVVDANEDHQVLTITALAPRGFEVKAVASGREATDLLGRQSFDAILVDAKVRDSSAFDLLAVLAQRVPDSPRILLVPVGGEEIALRGLAAGATAFVMKSPSFRLLIPAVVDRQIRDIRTRRHMEKELQESQRVLSTLMSNLPGMAYRCKNDPPLWTNEFVSDGAEPLTGYPAEAFVSGKLTYSRLIHPDDLARVVQAADEAVRTRRPFQILYRLQTASGAEKWVWEHGRAVYGANGEARALEGFVADVTERKVAQDQLERSERMFRAFFEDAADGILRIDVEGRVLAINPSGAAFLGRPLSEIIGHPLGEFLPAEEVPRARKYLSDVVANVPVPETFETLVVSPKDGRRVVEVRHRIVPSDPDHPTIELVARDITERRELVRKIAESERLASLGRLSLYVAHEINTPLTSIALLTAAIERSESDPAIREKLEKIHAQRRRAAAIIADLLNFSRPQRIEGKEADLRVIVQAAVEHVEPLRRAGVSLFARMGDRPVVARVDAAQMESVVVSLLKNALEATTHGSVIVHLDEVPEGINVQVTDTGEGMTKQVLERIFEPFFTTKRLGHGTGLGLAWSKKIVEGHGGKISVGSRPGGGSTFTVLLPRPTSPAMAAPAPALNVADSIARPSPAPVP